MREVPLVTTSPLLVRDPKFFLAVFPSNVWNKLTENLPNRNEIMGWTTKRVSVGDFVQPFKGRFGGYTYDSSYPVPRLFTNHNSCRPFADFTSQAIMERITVGPLGKVVKVGQCQPPSIVMPLTIEPSKPHLCQDQRYLNCWMREMASHLDSVIDLTRFVDISSQSSMTSQAMTMFYWMKKHIINCWNRQYSNTHDMLEVLKGLFWTTADLTRLFHSSMLSRRITRQMHLLVTSRLSTAPSPLGFGQLSNRCLEAPRDTHVASWQWTQTPSVTIMEIHFPGVNVFAHHISWVEGSVFENCYVFPPFQLIGPVLKFLREQKGTVRQCGTRPISLALLVAYPIPGVTSFTT
ncbi:hypothetical protein QZH41_017514, partial [Actinostola sp. cb2023]